MIPEEWMLDTLKRYIIIQSGYPFNSKQFCLNSKYIGLVRIRDLAKHKTETFFKGEYQDDYLIESGDILIGMDGDYHTVLWKGSPALLNQRICKVDSKSSDYLNHDYLFYLLYNEIPKINLQTASTTVKHLSKKDIFKIKTFIPPINEQRKIAAILSSVDRCIEATETMIAKLKDLKKALMQELLTKGLPPNVAAKYGIKKSGKFKDSPLGKIPKEWEVVNLQDICKRVTDGTHDTPKPSKYGFHLITSKNLKDGRIDIKNSYLISEQDYNEVNKRSEVNAGDVLFGMIGTVGNPVVVEEHDLPFAIKNVGLFKTNGDYKLSNWLCNYLSSTSFLKLLDAQLSGSSQRFVGLGFLRKLPVPKPQRKEMEFIVNVLNSIQDKIGATEKRKETSQSLKKALMQDLLTGKIRVKVDDVA